MKNEASEKDSALTKLKHFCFMTTSRPISSDLRNEKRQFFAVWCSFIVFSLKVIFEQLKNDLTYNKKCISPELNIIGIFRFIECESLSNKNELYIILKRL